MSTGVLLINLGTPDSTNTGDVRRYLRQFLSDPRVLDIPALGRWALLNLIILPTRPSKSAEAYREIWTDEGSPLLLHTRDLTEGVAAELGDSVTVRFAMRYQNPSIQKAMEAFDKEGVDRIVVVPLYPQYASSSSGSVLEELYKSAGSFWNVPNLDVVPPFYNDPDYQAVLADFTKAFLDAQEPIDYLLISFHGLPERHVEKCDTRGDYCLKQENCCDQISAVNRYCYRAQSFASARDLAKRMGLSEEQYGVAFQSRLGRTPWIQPYTDQVLEELPKQGKKRVAVVVPSFTSDCLETLEEIALRGKEDFMEAGGEYYVTVPCLNSDANFVRVIADMVRRRVPELNADPASV